MCADSRLREAWRVDDFDLFRLKVHLRKGRGLCSREATVEAEAPAEARGVEEGQGELIVLHGMALSEKRRAGGALGSAQGARQARGPHGEGGGRGEKDDPRPGDEREEGWSCARPSSGQGSGDYRRIVVVVRGVGGLLGVVRVEGQDVIGDPLRLGRGVENLATILLKNADP